MNDWAPPTYEDAKLGPMDRIRVGADDGRTRLDATWLPFVTGEQQPHLPAVDGFTLLGVGEFACPNDVEGEKRFHVPVYRCDVFVDALMRTGKLTHAPGPGEAPDCEFVLLPPPGHDGRFVMGAPASEARQYEVGEPEQLENERPQHEVQIARPFLLGRTAVTQRVYDAVGGERRKFQYPGELNPAESISWFRVTVWLKKRAKKVGLRLPSEAEWEFACRAGTQTPFCFGANPGLVNYDGNFRNVKPAKSKHRKRTVEVATLPANAFGLFEVHGNVWEWCQDKYHLSYDGAPSDGTARESPGVSSDDGYFEAPIPGGPRKSPNESDRVGRGGGFSDPAGGCGGCRSASRFGWPPDCSDRNLGFRLARSLP